MGRLKTHEERQRKRMRKHQEKRQRRAAAKIDQKKKGNSLSFMARVRETLFGKKK